MKKNEYIFVIAQQFYGNRTGTRIKPENIDCFIRGYLENCAPQTLKDVERRVVRVPGSDNVVIVYDQTSEDRYVNDEFPKTYADYAVEYCEATGKELCKHVSCKIPEIGFEIYTRCIACRMDKSGNFMSLEPGDEKLFMGYFPIK